MSPIRLAWLATHPTQYQAPLLRSISESPDIDLKVLYFSDFSIKEFVDPGFGRAIEWDIPLLDGYSFEFLSKSSGNTQAIGTFHPWIGSLFPKLNKDNYDAVLVQGWQHYGMVLAAWVAKRAGLKVFLRCEATDHVSASAGLKRVVRDKTIHFLLSQVDFCMAIGSRNEKFYLDRGFPAERIGFMPYCVDNNYFRSKAQTANVAKLRSQLRLDSNKPVILFSGKFTARKHPDKLLEAYQCLPEPRPYLVYVGDGELRPTLEAIVLKNRLKDVRFTGFCNQAELPGFYALGDIFVLPSVNETWGLVINEAMNARCAIITTAQVGAAADLVKAGVNGYTINSMDTSVLADALVKCLKGDAFRSMGEQSLKLINGWGIVENIDGLREKLDLNSVA